MHPHVRTCLNGFTFGLSLLPLRLLFPERVGGSPPLDELKASSINPDMISIFDQYIIRGWFLCHLLHPAAILIFFCIKYNNNYEKRQVLIRSYGLGWVFVTGLLIVGRDIEPPFGYYMMIMSFFHFSEFLTTAIINGEALSLDSFLLNHSREYGIAAAASWLEYLIEWFLFPSLKSLRLPMGLGILVCICGEIIRKSAMFTARENFTHLVREKKADGHTLITHGIYSFCRHPSYAGWFWWSIGTQIILMNPICIIGYISASWHFFARRIIYEEATLLTFFGQSYIDYKGEVNFSGVPFVDGYKIKRSKINKNKEL